MNHDMCCPEREREDDSCTCTPLPAMVFIPVQYLECVYEPEYGFRRGTIFPELDKPWLVEGGCRCGR